MEHGQKALSLGFVMRHGQKALSLGFVMGHHCQFCHTDDRQQGYVPQRKNLLDLKHQPANGNSRWYHLVP